MANPTRAAAGSMTAEGEMRAIVQDSYGSARVLRYGRAPRPEIAENEVLVRVHAAGMDRGTWHMMTGRPYLLRVLGFGFRRPKTPVPGIDVAGIVVSVGPAVSRFAVGMRFLEWRGDRSRNTRQCGMTSSPASRRSCPLSRQRWFQSQRAPPCRH